MLDGYAPNRRFDHCVLDVYSAKRAAESALGVGPQTDLVRIDNGGMGEANDDNLKEFEKIYQKKIKRIHSINDKAKDEMAAFMEALNAQTAQVPTQEAPQRGQGGGDDQEGVRRGVGEAER